jgi:hypothetical protein
VRREYVCKNPACTGYQNVPTMTADEELHCECGAVLELAVYPIASVWVGEMSAKYLDRSKEGGDKQTAGHWAFEKGEQYGKGAKPVYLETWQQQKEFCKRNGLARPQDMPNNYEVADDGRTVKNSVGLPGCEV